MCSTSVEQNTVYFTSNIMYFYGSFHNGVGKSHKSFDTTCKVVYSCKSSVNKNREYMKFWLGIFIYFFFSLAFLFWRFQRNSCCANSILNSVYTLYYLTGKLPLPTRFQAYLPIIYILLLLFSQYQPVVCMIYKIQYCFVNRTIR